MKRSPIRAVCKQWLAWALIASLTLLGPAKEAQAMLAPALPSQMQSAPYDRAADLKTVQRVLESKLLRERLEALGLNESEIQGRLSKMSDQEVHQFAAQIHAVVPGGDSALGVIMGVLVLGILVLLFIYLFQRVT